MEDRKAVAQRKKAVARPRRTAPTPMEAIKAAAPEEWIRVAAYFRAERRGFAPGHEVEDWLEAEGEVRDVVLGS